MSAPANMPTTVGALRAFQVEIRCRRCGRVAPIEAEKMNSAAGRALDRRMKLTDFLARLTCTAKACGEKPIQLHLGFRGPRGPGDAPKRIQRWVMDRHGRWASLGTDPDGDTAGE